MRIIPEQLNKKLKKEYKMRFFTLLFFCFSISILIILALMSSSYLLLHLYEKAYVKQSPSSDVQALELFQKNIQKINSLYQLSSKVIETDTFGPIDISRMVFEYSNDFLKISSIEISRDSKITIRGAATTRESLIDFENKMKSNSIFRDFTIPVETLTKQRDIGFGITFTYYEN
jgi:hypothetical protein